jgi:hypothetical protein
MRDRLAQELELGDGISRRLLETERERLIQLVKDPKLRQQHVDSLARLQKDLDEIVYDCRMLASFDRWIERPGQAILFQRYCRSAFGDWERAIEQREAPLVFQHGPETQERHLSYCSLCRIARRLAEGQVRMRRANLDHRLRGDEILASFVAVAVEEALFQAQVPELPGGEYQTLVPGHGGEPQTLTVPSDQCTPLNGHLLVPARLAGGVGNARVEINVTWQPVAGEMETLRPALAFPNAQHTDSVVMLDDHGRCEIRLLVPRNIASRGVVFKYCGHTVESSGVRHLLTCARTPNSTTDLGSGGKVRTRGAIRKRGLEEQTAPPPPGDSRPPPAAPTPTPVRVAAASLKWSEYSR